MSPNLLEENPNMQPQQQQPMNGGMDFPNLLAPSGGQSSMDNLQAFGNYKNKNSYSKYNGGGGDDNDEDESSSFTSPSYLIKPQGKSHFRERNRAHLRHVRFTEFLNSFWEKYLFDFVYRVFLI